MVAPSSAALGLPGNTWWRHHLHGGTQLSSSSLLTRTQVAARPDVVCGPCYAATTNRTLLALEKVLLMGTGW